MEHELCSPRGKRGVYESKDEADATEAGNCDVSIFQDGLRHAAEDKQCRNVTLWDFVDRSDHQDFITLKHAWQQQTRRRKKHQWIDIKFVDTLHGSQYRRWHYRKEGLFRRLRQTVLANGNLVVRFETRLEISDMTPQAMVSVLRQVPNDPDISTLHILGDIPCSGIAQVMDELITLVEQRDRKWNGIVFNLIPVVTTDALSSPTEQREELSEGERVLKKRCRELEDAASCLQIPIVIKKDWQ